MHIADDAVAALEAKQAILVFTGAGLSTDSGIPDFRGPDGLWTKVDPDDYTIDRYLTSPDVRARGWERRGKAVIGVAPNDGHRAITRMWDAGLLAGCVTQNVDGLHRAAGLPDEGLAEVHGSTTTTSCVACSLTMPTRQVLERVTQGESDPRCECGGILKPDVVFFGEHLPDQAMARATGMAERADAVLAVGTTLSVFPAAGIPLHAMRRGAPLVIINRGPTDFDDLAAVVIDAGASETLRILADGLAGHGK